MYRIIADVESDQQAIKDIVTHLEMILPYMTNNVIVRSDKVEDSIPESDYKALFINLFAEVASFVDEDNEESPLQEILDNYQHFFNQARGFDPNNLSLSDCANWSQSLYGNCGGRMILVGPGAALCEACYNGESKGLRQ